MITMSHGGLYIKGYKTCRLRNLIEIDLDYNSNIPNIPKPYYILTPPRSRIGSDANSRSAADGLTGA